MGKSGLKDINVWQHSATNFFLKFLEDISPFRETTDTPVLDFWRRLPWVSKPGWIPHLHALLPACNKFLRFTSGATPADYIEVSMTAEPFNPCTCRRVHKHWWRFGAQTYDRLCHKHGAVDHSATPSRPFCNTLMRNIATEMAHINVVNHFVSISG